MRSGARLVLGLDEVEQHSKLRGTRKKRSERGRVKRLVRDTQNMSSRLARLCQENGLPGNNCFSSMMAVSLLANGSTGPLRIGTTHIANLSIIEQDRDSQILTGSMFRVEDSFNDTPCGSGLMLSQKWSSRCISWLRYMDASRLINQCLGASNLLQHSLTTIQQQSNHTTSAWRHSVGTSTCDERCEPDYNEHNLDTLRERSSPLPFQLVDPGQLCYRLGNSSPSSGLAIRESSPRESRLDTSISFSHYPVGHDDGSNGDNRGDYNDGRYGRDAHSAPQQRPHSNWRSPYYHPIHSCTRRRSMRVPNFRRKSLRTGPETRHSEYMSEFCDRIYYDERQSPYYGSSFPRDASDSNLPPRKSCSFKQSLYYPSGHDNMSDVRATQQQRPWEEPPTSWGGPSGQNQSLYQDRFSDEDFTESDQLDSETEESSADRSKKLVKHMWKTLTKERGVLVTHDGRTSLMTREHTEYVKKTLLEKAADPSKMYPENWRPRFLRTGLVHRSGLYQMICKDYQTLLWVLRQEIPPLNGHKFKILKRPYDWDCGPVRINTWLPSEPYDLWTTLQTLDTENPGIRATDWRLVAINLEEGWRQVVADVSRDSALYLESNGWTFLYWNNILPVTRMTTLDHLSFNAPTEDIP